MPIRLDARLQTIADLARCETVADIGCDHGKLSYYLVSTDRAKKAIATDISAESLEKAEELAYANGAEGLIDLRVGDGLAPVKSGEADMVVIAGLGGDVISGIIKRAYSEGKRFDCFLLSPNTHPEKVRRILTSVGHNIVEDKTIMCGKKAYTIIKSKEGGGTLDELQEIFGKFYGDDMIALDLMRKELAFKREVLKTNPDAETLKNRIALIEKAIENAENYHYEN